ncbi:hypothetical protein KHC33_10975 [Methanospirillum sp. J.3.6.1-F.2.7.3]|uniref:Uncharacterized protein n=1 Tax=Methanospirillum purgamenti TaxID=2834276 RepID=A0A8E7B052_9EURY|nr:hypothetical protein [Methanospirillum sp. J.3.6.1-F.2.7.3]QVV87861.1 hypothetical protein KHC33_10975 [Methanospirillum sp. J.3.6.1-F.2.7.3]
MSNLIEKFQKIVTDISTNKGTLNLFALSYRENDSQTFDLLISARWINIDDFYFLKYIENLLKQELDSNDILKISRIVLLDPEETSVKAITNCFYINEGNLTIQHSLIGNVPILKMVIFSSNK